MDAFSTTNTSSMQSILHSPNKNVHHHNKYLVKTRLPLYIVTISLFFTQDNNDILMHNYSNNINSLVKLVRFSK